MGIAPSPILDGVDEAECGVLGNILLGNILLGRGQTRNVMDLTPLPVIQSGRDPPTLDIFATNRSLKS